MLWTWSRLPPIGIEVVLGQIFTVVSCNETPWRGCADASVS